MKEPKNGAEEGFKERTMGTISELMNGISAQVDGVQQTTNRRNTKKTPLDNVTDNPEDQRWKGHLESRYKRTKRHITRE